TSALGHHPSVATRRLGGDTTMASTSPPPVSTSSAASASAIRSPNMRAYPHGGRSSVARPSNHEKSPPSTGTPAPSAARLSKRLTSPGLFHFVGFTVSDSRGRIHWDGFTGRHR